MPRARDPRVGRRRGRGERGKRYRQPVEPVVTADLLDEVRLPLRVDAPHRNGHRPSVSRVGEEEAETLENPADVRIGNGRAQQAGDLLASQAKHARPDWLWIPVDDRAAWTARAHEDPQR